MSTMDQRDMAWQKENHK